MNTEEDTLDDLIPAERLRKLAAQAGGFARYRDEEQIALIKARRRGFPKVEQARAYAVIVLLGRCGSRPGPEDYERFAAASGEDPRPKKKHAKVSQTKPEDVSPYDL